MKKRFFSLLLAAILIVTALPAAAFAAQTAGLSNFAKTNTYADGKFTDVKADDWFEKNVSAAYELNLMVGKGDDFFDTENNLTVAEAMTIAARLRSIYYTGKAEFEQGEPWYQVYANYCKINGVADPADYDMNKAVTRGEFAEIFAKAFPSDALKKINTVHDNMIPDVKKADKFGAAIYLLYRAGILVGNDSKGTFAPDTNIKRAEAAAITTRMADSSLREKISLVDPAYDDWYYVPPTPAPIPVPSTTITLDACGGTGASTSVVVKIGDKSVAITNPTKTDLTFTGWYTLATDGDLVIATDGNLKKNVASYTDIDGKWICNENSITLYAKWTGTTFKEIGGVKWATKNLGAEKETDYGDYFAWGEIAPYYEGTGGRPATPTWKSGKANGYACQSYCGSSSFSEWNTPPYDATTKILKPEFDAATALLGSDWCMPTSADFEALYVACGGSDDPTSYDKTTNPGKDTPVGKGIYWCTNYDGVAGCLFCDGTNKLFFPAAGNGDKTSFDNAGSRGFYWSSSLYTGTDQSAYELYFDSDCCQSPTSERRYYGFSVRPVVKKDDGPCVAAGTIVTMGNGEQKLIEELEIGDVIRTFDHETGEISSAPVCFIWITKNASGAFTLTFEGDVKVTVIEEHGFYDFEEKQYVFINAENANDYIGHHFYDADNASWRELKSVEVLNGCVDAYSIITSGHLNHLSNGILSICDGTIKPFANVFEYDDYMKYDADKKEADLKAYGLTSLETVLQYAGFIEQDYSDYNLQYLDVMIGKGIITWEWMEALSEAFVEMGIVDNPIYIVE